VAVADLTTGMYATVAILAAVAQREKTGRGQFIDLALLDTQVAMLANMNLNYLTSGRAPGRAGNAHANIVPYQVFAAADGQVIVAVGNDGQFVKFCEVAGCAALAADPRFARNADRVRNRDVLIPLLEPIVRSQPVAFWAERLEAADVPCGPIHSVAQAFADPQVVARGMRFDLPHPTAGSVPQVASPIRMSDSPAARCRAPPVLGQHTDEVLRELAGCSDADIAALRARGAI
jgi:crotonobetainyl-CoA:carnitine CoA-transferase CaiB-like acyl-CoA transferase